ncbi:MAG: hypothetical protein ABMA14_02235 [Hyphomonadaceae bacterium]
MRYAISLFQNVATALLVAQTRFENVHVSTARTLAVRWAADKDGEFIRLEGLNFEHVEELIGDADDWRPVLLPPQEIGHVKPIPRRS